MVNEFRNTLYTVDVHGNRQWVYSDQIKGRWYRIRFSIAWILIGIYLTIPWIQLKGKQAVLLDFARSQFTFFGTTFWSTDTIFLVILFGGFGIALFFFTAILGRIWCGWACPETIFLEFVFRPIDRLLEGKAAKRRRLDKSKWSARKLRVKVLKGLIYGVISWLLATTTLAYFLGASTMLEMASDWPSEHPVPFMSTLGLMALLLFQFGWFREQFCSLVCPYARFQSVLMDSDSLMVGYDVCRGEPRMRGKRGSASISERGDCIDCGLCVRVCPAGIDIRNGLQLECVACTACIDACDSVMESIDLPYGLIRYDTENELLGKFTRIFRPRVFIYSALLFIYIAVFFGTLALRETSEAQLTRAVKNTPYSLLTNGSVLNHFSLRVVNKSREARVFSIKAQDAQSVSVVLPVPRLKVLAGEMKTTPVFVQIKQSELVGGKRKVTLIINDDAGYSDRQLVTVLGPGS